MDNLGLYGLAFLISTVKFLFAASILSASSSSPFMMAISTGLGALFSFNVFYLSAGYFMKKAKEKLEKRRASGNYKPKPYFTRMNKWMVKTKMSKSGFWVICILGPLFLSIPVGSIIVAKFYGENAKTYPVAVSAIIVWAFVLAYLNGAIFSLFK